MLHSTNYAHTGRAMPHHRPRYHQPHAAARSSTNSKPRPRQTQPPTFNPDELTRRLHLVLAEQKARAEKKRRAKAEAAKIAAAASVPNTGEETDAHVAVADISSDCANKATQSLTRSKSKKRSSKKPPVSAAPVHGGSHDTDAAAAPYHHVPSEAASQFTRTTTADPPTDPAHLVHKLSRKAIRFHREGPNADPELAAASLGGSPFEHAAALRRVQEARGREFERNQFQLSRTISNAAADSDHGRSKNKAKLAHRHSLQPHLIPAEDAHALLKRARRNSTGSAIGNDDGPTSSSSEAPRRIVEELCASVDRCELVATAEEHRVDWTQRDEADAAALAKTQTQTSSTPAAAAAPPPLNKTESRWKIRGRIGSFGKVAGKDDRTAESQNAAEVAEGENPHQHPLKSPKSGFFSRFKR